MTLKPIYSNRVSILNKLKRDDGTSGSDEWFVTVVDNVAWYRNSERTVSNSGVYIGEYKTILIPFNKAYLPYDEWKNNTEGHFTVSEGDYIVLGEVTEDITAKNVVSVMKKLDKSKVCFVKSVIPREERFGAKVQVKVEGV